MGRIERIARGLLLFAGVVAVVVYHGLWTLLVGRPLGLVSRRLRREFFQRIATKWGRRLVAWTKLAARVRLEVEGAAPADEGPLVVVSNHQSHVDTPVLYSLFPRARLRFIVKRELKWGIPNVSPAVRYGGAAFVSRKAMDRTQFEAVRRLGEEIVADGSAAVVFPEGTRSRDGELGKFHAAGLVELLRGAGPQGAANLRVVPVSIDGTWRAATLGGIFRELPGATVRVRIGEPLPAPSPEDDKPARELVARIRDDCVATLAHWRAVRDQEAALREPAAPAR